MAGVDCWELWDVVVELEKIEMSLEASIEECAMNSTGRGDMYAVIQGQLEDEVKKLKKQIGAMREWLCANEGDFDPTWYGPGTRNRPGPRNRPNPPTSSSDMPPDYMLP